MWYPPRNPRDECTCLMRSSTSSANTPFFVTRSPILRTFLPPNAGSVFLCWPTSTRPPRSRSRLRLCHHTLAPLLTEIATTRYWIRWRPLARFFHTAVLFVAVFSISPEIRKGSSAALALAAVLASPSPSLVKPCLAILASFFCLQFLKLHPMFVKVFRATLDFRMLFDNFAVVFFFFFFSLRFGRRIVDRSPVSFAC